MTGERALHRTIDIPLPSPKQRWVLARSSHFLTLSSAGERRTREVVGELETLLAVLRRIDPHFAAEGELTRMILFARARDAQPYFELIVGQRLPGAFVTNAEGVATILIDGSRSDSDRPFFHELVHNALTNSGTHLPLWLEEGIAEYYSSAEVTNQAVHVGRPIREHMVMMRSRPPMKLADLFAVERGSDISLSSLFYGQSWSVVDWMMRADRVAFFEFLDDVERGASSLDALQSHFHVDPGIIERNIQGAQVRPAARSTLRVDENVEPALTQPLEYTDVIVELANFLGGFEATRDDGERFLNAAFAADPKNGHAVAAMAALRAKEKRYGEATKLYEQALQLSPDDANIRLTFAESLLGNAIGPFSGTVEVEADAAPRFRRARQLAGEALTAGADPARADAAIGTSYLVEPDVRPGIEALRRAHAMRPNRDDVALSLYALLLRTGDRDAAEHLYKEISSRARTPQAIFAAKVVYLREQLTIVNRLIAENRVADAIPVLSQLIDATSDPTARADLQRQLVRVIEVGEANKQITTFNEAIAAANQGHEKKAIQILESLLETANDPKVIKDAIAFRTELQKRAKRR
ncbi:MAG: DUF1570 domain-containing protein [Thermoanaerobaculia bacterium]